MFDPYHKWLGIPQKDQPPNHYQLLSLDLYENDLDVIEGAADRLMYFVRQYQSGEHAALAAKLLNEIATARLCLLKPASKAPYDAKLKREIAAKESAEDETHSIGNDAELSELVKASKAYSKPPSKTASKRKKKNAKLFPSKYLPTGVATIVILLLLAIFLGPKWEQTEVVQALPDSAAAPTAAVPRHSSSPAAEIQSSKMAETVGSKQVPTGAKYIVNLSPADSNLQVTGNKVAVTGSGGEWVVATENPNGIHRLSVTHDGYKPIEYELSFEKGVTKSVTITLEKIKPNLMPEPKVKPSPQPASATTVGIFPNDGTYRVVYDNKHARTIRIQNNVLYVETWGQDRNEINPDRTWKAMFKKNGNKISVELGDTLEIWHATPNGLRVDHWHRGANREQSRTEQGTVTKLSDQPCEVVSVWEHKVEGGGIGSVTLFSNGKINHPAGKNTYRIQGKDLWLNWVNDKAPGGVWVDKCKISADGRTYSGKNQNGTKIAGKLKSKRADISF